MTRQQHYPRVSRPKLADTLHKFQSHNDMVPMLKVVQESQGSLTIQ